jgi:hypothetical protein
MHVAVFLGIAPAISEEEKGSLSYFSIYPDHYNNPPEHNNNSQSMAAHLNG